jgi:hypothetical protein
LIAIIVWQSLTAAFGDEFAENLLRLFHRDYARRALIRH